MTPHAGAYTHTEQTRSWTVLAFCRQHPIHPQWMLLPSKEVLFFFAVAAVVWTVQCRLLPRVIFVLHLGSSGYPWTELASDNPCCKDCVRGFFVLIYRAHMSPLQNWRGPQLSLMQTHGEADLGLVHSDAAMHVLHRLLLIHFVASWLWIGATVGSRESNFLVTWRQTNSPAWANYLHHWHHGLQA